MSNSIDNERNEKLFDAVLKIAAEEAMVERMEALPTREELARLYPRSPVFDKRIAKIIGKHARAKKRTQALKYFYRAAAVFAVFFAISITTLMSVEASRNFILSRLYTIISVGDGRFSIEFREIAFEKEGIGFTLDYLPVDFELANSIAGDFISVVTFSNDAGQTIIVSMLEAEGLGAGISDTRQHISTSIRGHEAHLFQAVDETEYSTLMWLYGRYAMQIISNADIDEVMRVAASLQKK